MDGRSQSTGSRSASAIRADVFDVQTVSIAVAVLVVFISILLYLLGRRNTRTSVLLVGLSDAGKTALFTQLAHNTFTETVTSMKENEEEIRTNGSRRVVTLVDVPGFERLRNQFWEKLKFRALGVVYVIDSVTFMSNLHNVADLLYQYLSDDFVISKRIPFLVACTKQDETRAKTAKAIFTQLEKEFNTIRETRLGALDTTSGDGEVPKILGNPKREFSFADLSNSIEFIDCSSSPKSSSSEAIIKWIDSTV